MERHSLHWNPEIAAPRAGAILGFVGDLMERNHTEELVLEKDTWLRLILEQLPAILWTTDTRLIFTSCGGSGLSLINLKPGETVGKSLYDYFQTDNDAFAPIAAHIKAIVHGEKASYELFWCGHDFEYSVEPLRDGNRRIIGAIGLGIDITARKQAEELIKKSNKELKQLDQLRSEFTSMVSHELKTPLAIIQECVSIIMDRIDGPLTTEQWETLSIAQRNAKRLGRLIHNVLDFTRLEEGKMQLFLNETDMSMLILDVCQMMKVAANKKGLTLTTHLPNALNVVVCDAERIRQVAINLIDNAIKFSPKGGNVKVAFEEKGGTAIMEVEDDGPGVAREDRERIFETFMQGGSHAPGGEGSGLGLSICKKIMQAHRGEISVRNKAHGGAVFSIKMPARLADPEEFLTIPEVRH